MRTLTTTPTLSLHAVAGTHVVALGMDMPEQAAQGLMGFTIWRKELPAGEWKSLEGMKYFKGIKMGGGEGAAGSSTSTAFHPIQDFFWSDFTVRPGRAYTYRVIAQTGKPGQLEILAEVSTTVKTESDADARQKHAVYFNRGIAGSQAFVRKFGSGRFEQIATDKPWVWEWLSRGLVEGLRGFIQMATGSEWAIRGAVYEFEYEPVLTELAQAARRGADVQIVWAAMTDSESAKKVTQDNEEAIQRVFAGSTATLIPRTQSGDIPHNKFFVLLKGAKPVAVWTGSTNITTGGIFGHSNVGHLIRDKRVAAQYLSYWELLKKDVKKADLSKHTGTQLPDTWFADKPKKKISEAIFSPRPTVAALDWYADLMRQSDRPAFITVPFGLDKRFEAVMAQQTARRLIYVISDRQDKDLQTEAIKNNPFNQTAFGTLLKDDTNLAGWIKERLTGLNKVNYLHTKYLLIDPLGDAPWVISGSANFSENSVRNNDENMLVLRGDKRVADIYFSEFMRIFRHFYFRDIATAAASKSTEQHERIYLHEDSEWVKKYYDPTHPAFAMREYFGGKAKG